MLHSNMNNIDRGVRGAAGLLLVIISPLGLDLIPSSVMGWFCLFFGAANLVATLTGICFMYSLVGISSAPETDAESNSFATPQKLDYNSLRRKAVLGFGAIALVVSALFTFQSIEAAKQTAGLSETRALHDTTTFVVDEIKDHTDGLLPAIPPLEQLSREELLESLYHFDEPMLVLVTDGQTWTGAGIQLDSGAEERLSSAAKNYFPQLSQSSHADAKSHAAALKFGDLPLVEKVPVYGELYNLMAHKLNLNSGVDLTVILARRSSSGEDAFSTVIKSLSVSSFIVFWLAIWGAVGVAYFISRHVIGANERAYQLATTDSFTGLPNEIALREVMLQDGRFSPERDFRVVGMHLRDLSTIASNTSFEVLSQMLKGLGDKLKSFGCESCQLARLSDGTIILIAPEEDEDSFCAFRDLLNETQSVGDYRFNLEPTEVELHYPSDVDSFESLRMTITKLVSVANRLRLPILRFEHLEATDKRSKYAPEIRRALEKREFEVYLQPKVDLASLGVCGAEALVRWNHPEDGLLSPVHFIDIISSSNVRSQFACYIIDETCGLSRRLKRSGRDILLSLNLSAEDILDAEVQVKLSEASKSLDLKNNPVLEVELTEGETGIDPARIKEALRIISWLGYRIALDDFGTGMSSLSYTHELPINTIKIDKSFIDNVDRYESAIVPIKAISMLAQGYGYDVVAEGVERASQLKVLQSLGCTVVQGYIFSQPLPFNEFERYEPKAILTEGSNVHQIGAVDRG